MMNTQNSINKTETITTVYTNYEIIEVKVIPFSSCKVTVLLSSNEGNRKIVNLAMETDDYVNWNNDDQYLIDWINTKLMSE